MLHLTLIPYASTADVSYYLSGIWGTLWKECNIIVVQYRLFLFDLQVVGDTRIGVDNDDLEAFPHNDAIVASLRH